MRIRHILQQPQGGSAEWNGKFLKSTNISITAHNVMVMPIVYVAQ